MRIDLKNNFISAEDICALNLFTLSAIDKGLFEDGRASKHLNPEGAHLVSRFNKTISFPQIAFSVREKIM